MRRYLGVIVAAVLLGISLVIYRKRQNQGGEEKMRAADLATKRGGIYSYIHHNNRLGVLLELNCNTNRVAQSERFLQLASELALQIAAADPTYINFEDIPTDIVEKTRKVIAETGENIVLRRFRRYAHSYCCKILWCSCNSTY